MNHKDIEKLAKISTLNKMYGCYRDTDSLIIYDPNMTGGFTMNNEFPIKIIIGNGEDAYEEVYKAIEKYFYDEDGIMIATDYYVTLEMGYDNSVSWITTCLEYDNDLDDFVWNTDWWEGENNIVIHGVAAVSSLHFYGFHRDRDIIEYNP